MNPKSLLFQKYQHNDIDSVPDSWWTNGYCSIFAYCLYLRFNLPMYALLEVRFRDAEANLLHAVGVRGSEVWDADGQCSISQLKINYSFDTKNNWKQHGDYFPNETSRLVFKRISVRRLGEVHHDFDPDKVYFANLYIEQHRSLFATLEESR
jgi:hypothetical protein